MNQNNARLDVMRALDGFDRIGASGVFDRLTKGRRDASGDWTPGCGLTDAQAFVLTAFIDVRGRAGTRMHTMCILEETAIRDGYSLWDKLLDMPVDADNNWSDGRRPANIAIALDDIAAVMARSAG